VSTSGVSTFSVTTSDIINGALRLTGAFGASDAVPTSDYNNALQALNIMIKSLMTSGYELWTIQELQLPIVQGITSYTI
jgi:hypothetical protein